MIKTRRWKPLAAVLSALIAIGAGLWITQSGGRPLTPEQMLSHLPRGEATYFYADVAGIRGSGILDKTPAAVAQEAEYKTFVTQTGFDYARDLDRLAGRSQGATQLLLLQGRFDWDRLREYAQRQGGKCSGELCSVRGQTPNRVVSFLKLRSNTMALAFSDREGVASEVKERQEPVAVANPGKPLWIVMPSSVLRESAAMPAGTKLFATALEPAERVLFSVTPIERNFELAMDVTCRKAEDAAILKAQLEGITGMLQKMITRSKQQPSPNDLSGILTSGKFERTGANVLARWPIPAAFVESLSAGN